MGQTLHEVVVIAGADRVDRALASALPLSRTRIRSLIEAGLVRVDGAVVGKPSVALRAGARVTVAEPARAASTLRPAAIPLAILYEDDSCLVVDKPAGLVVHPGAGHPEGTLLHALLHLRPEVAGVGEERKSGLVHRLDKDTSGCLLVAKTDTAHRALSAQFAARTVEKAYWAFVWGHLPAEAGVFDAPIGRALRDRQRMSSRTARGRPARTRWRVLERYAVAEWLEVELETGRTHQIRVHLAEAGHPVLGDARYGGGPARARGFHGPQQAWAREVALAATRQALHARAIAFDPPAGGGRACALAPLPPDLEELRESLRRRRV